MDRTKAYCENTKFRKIGEVMGYKKLTSGNGESFKDFVTTRKWKEWKAGEWAIGKRVKCNDKDKFKKPIYGLEVESTNIPGLEAGEFLYLNTGGNFKNLIEQVSLGQGCKVIFHGMAKIKTGEWAGQQTYNIEVQIPDDAEDEESESDEDLLG